MKVAILGAGESGIGAALLAKEKNLAVTVFDQGKIQERFAHELREAGISFQEETQESGWVSSHDLFIKSPGIPEENAWVQAIRAEEKELVSEIEFASRYCPGRIVGITGTNGKTTTTNLVWHILHSCGKDAVKCGNVGTSFARVLASGQEHEYYVVEMSSFQLDDVSTLKPFISILLNITPDHLDRYQYKLENYVRAKFRIACNQGPSEHFLYNPQSPPVFSYLETHEVRAHKIGFALQQYRQNPVVVDGISFDVSDMPIQGEHNRFNTVCAIQAALLSGCQPEDIRACLSTFVNDPHRMERVGTYRGVEYINDSKATNTDSTYYALEAQDRPVIWIVGGVDKGNDYSSLLPFVREKVRQIICLGKENEKIIRFFSPYFPDIRECRSTDDVVRLADSLAKEGDVVLLSPACASFDLFKNYEDRGKQFRESVQKLIAGTW